MTAVVVLIGQSAWEGAHDGFYAWVNGVVPFGDPISSSHFYNPNDSTLAISRFLGGISRDVWIAVVIPNLSQFAKNPWLYEAAHKTLPTALFEALGLGAEGLSTIDKGRKIVAAMGWFKALLVPLPGPYLITVREGLTPLANLTIIAVVDLADQFQIVDKIRDYINPIFNSNVQAPPSSSVPPPATQPSTQPSVPRYQWDIPIKDMMPDI